MKFSSSGQIVDIVNQRVEDASRCGRGGGEVERGREERGAGRKGRGVEERGWGGGSAGCAGVAVRLRALLTSLPLKLQEE